MVFDGTINLGHILNTFFMLGGFIYFVWELKSSQLLLRQETTLRHEANTKEFTKIDKNFETVNAQLDKLSQTAIELAKQDMRLNNFDSRLLELSTRIHSHFISDIPKKRVKA